MKSIYETETTQGAKHGNRLPDFAPQYIALCLARKGTAAGCRGERRSAVAIRQATLGSGTVIVIVRATQVADRCHFSF